MLLALISPAGTVLAQSGLQTQTGVIQELAQADGYIVISGVRHEYDSENCETTLRGEPFDEGSLELGMVVRFTIRSGALASMEILGPNNLIEGINNH